MTKGRTKITVSYRVLDENGKTLEVFKKTGMNRRYLKWLSERHVKHKYSRKKVTLHEFKVEETD